MKKQIAAALCALAATAFVVGDVQAASWYVDNAVAAPGNGQSWATAFRKFSDVAWANVHPGDVVYISGGPSGGTKTYTESWSVGASGTSGNPITITVDAANASHNGSVVFDYDALGDNATVSGITLSGRSYITMSGNVNGQNHIALKNLRNIANRTAATCIYGDGITATIIDHIDITNCNNGLALFSRTAGTEIGYSNLTQIRGDAAIAVQASGTTWDEVKIHDNSIETLNNDSYGGPDGIQPYGGMSAYRNTFKVSKTSLITSDQHPDMFQLQGNYNKIYGNEFVNVGDSEIDYDCYNNSTPHDVWIYNNVFHVVQVIDAYPEYFRLYNSSGNAITSITNFKILNNTFVDNTGMDNGSPTGFVTMRFNGFNSDPTGSGNEIKNNIFYNCGNGSQYQNVYIAASTGFTDASFSLDANIYYNSTKAPHIYYNGTDYPAANWIAAREPHGKIGAPTFVSYSPNNANNDLHLGSADTVAKEGGVSLSSYFTDDKEGVLRPQGSAWDIGAYEARPEAGADGSTFPATDAGAGGNASGSGGAGGALPGAGGDQVAGSMSAGGSAVPPAADAGEGSGCGCRMSGGAGRRSWIAVALALMCVAVRSHTRRRRLARSALDFFARLPRPEMIHNGSSGTRGGRRCTSRKF